MTIKTKLLILEMAPESGWVRGCWLLYPGGFTTGDQKKEQLHMHVFHNVHGFFVPDISPVVRANMYQNKADELCFLEFIQ